MTRREIQSGTDDSQVTAKHIYSLPSEIAIEAKKICDGTNKILFVMRHVFAVSDRKVDLLYDTPDLFYRKPNLFYDQTSLVYDGPDSVWDVFHFFQTVANSSVTQQVWGDTTEICNAWLEFFFAINQIS